MALIQHSCLESTQLDELQVEAINYVYWDIVDFVKQHIPWGGRGGSPLYVSKMETRHILNSMRSLRSKGFSSFAAVRAEVANANGGHRLEGWEWDSHAARPISLFLDAFSHELVLRECEENRRHDPRKA